MTSRHDDRTAAEGMQVGCAAERLLGGHVLSLDAVVQRANTEGDARCFVGSAANVPCQRVLRLVAGRVDGVTAEDRMVRFSPQDGSTTWSIRRTAAGGSQ